MRSGSGGRGGGGGEIDRQRQREEAVGGWGVGRRQRWLGKTIESVAGEEGRWCPRAV